MSTKENRRSLNVLNDTLRADNLTLKSKQNEMLAHIETLIKRQKQLVKLKAQLLEELDKAQLIRQSQKQRTQEKCYRLQGDITELRKELQTLQIQTKNLEEEYQLCARDYDQVIEEVQRMMAQNNFLSSQVQNQREKQSTIKAMIFDYERLQRVLQEQKKYFRQLSRDQELSHAQRMRELEKIRKQLANQQQEVSQRKRLDRFRLGFLKFGKIFNLKLRKYGQHIFRNHFKYIKSLELQVSTLGNCLSLADNRWKKVMKGAFWRWNSCAFNKKTIGLTTQRSVKHNFQSRTKIKSLLRMIQRLNSDHLSLLHLYQRTKFIGLTAGAREHKEKHIFFSIWRENSAKISSIDAILKKSFQTLSHALKRFAFSTISSFSHIYKRLQLASNLLQDYEKTKQLSKGMRKWRLQVHNREYQIVQRYIKNLNTHDIIQKRINYQKRKVKTITALQLKMTKIQLRNYFVRYYYNVKRLNINELNRTISEVKQQFSIARKENLSLTKFYKKAHLERSVQMLGRFTKRNKINPYFKKWKNTTTHLTQRNVLLRHCVLRKEAKNKLQVMNEFRKVVQYHEKRAMHQVLTDLNNKMEAINEKSSQFRKALQQTIQSLGIQSSKKLNQVVQYTLSCQKRVFFNFDCRMNIKKQFKNYLITKALEIFTFYSYRNTLQVIHSHSKEVKKNIILQKNQKQFLKNASDRLIRKVFFGIFGSLKTHKNAFGKLIHVQNVMYFYRLQCAMLAIMKKSHCQIVKSQNEHTEELKKTLTSRIQQVKGLKKDKAILQEKLQNIFKNFIKFQDRCLLNKDRNHQKAQIKKYFSIYRQNIRRKEYSRQVLENLMRFFEQKNYFIFWKSLIWIKSEFQQVLLKEQLANINKKKKTFEEKSTKIISDTQKKLLQQSKQHRNLETEAKYYTSKHQQILSYYDRHHIQQQSNLYLSKVFKVWKREYKGAKSIGDAIYRILRRTQLIQPYNLLFQEFRRYDFQFKGQLLCNKILQKEEKKLLVAGFNYWRYNMRHGYCDSIRYKIVNIDEYYEEIKNGIFSRGQLMANERIRNKYFHLKSKIFMAFKNEWMGARQLKKKMSPLQSQIERRRINEAMRNWKWLIFYKKTKRQFLAQKSKLMSMSLKRDVFQTLKNYREQVYNFCNLTGDFIHNRKYHLIRFALSKIINVASMEKNELIHARKRALHTLLMKKTTSHQLIKRKIMWKWQSWLIPRQHYLPNILQKIQHRILKSAFANINEKKFWHQHYIKDIADKVTTEGYNDVNAVTNIIIGEGFDPDQLKGYLRERNQKDQNILNHVIKHMKAWPEKQMMIRGFHSWKEFITLKKQLKQKLSKILNHQSGLGRYWNKWRSKDPEFNRILQKESRANMLQRYKDLERLMKEYRRDLKDSEQNCAQLRQINDQKAKSTNMTVQMALSNLSNNVQKGMKQTLLIWRTKTKKLKGQEMNKRYQELVDGIQMINSQKSQVKARIERLEQERYQLREKCKWGNECGELLRKMVMEKDGLAVDLAEKQHNLKVLLEDNLRLKQKIKAARENAMKLISRMREEESIQ